MEGTKSKRRGEREYGKSPLKDMPHKHYRTRAHELLSGRHRMSTERRAHYRPWRAFRVVSLISSASRWQRQRVMRDAVFVFASGSRCPGVPAQQPYMVLFTARSRVPVLWHCIYCVAFQACHCSRLSILAYARLCGATECYSFVTVRAPCQDSRVALVLQWLDLSDGHSRVSYSLTDGSTREI